jgi:hypothetical protein
MQAKEHQRIKYFVWIKIQIIGNPPEICTDKNKASSVLR